jgi:hypothetical protein
VVGALAVGRHLESLGFGFELGGISWERFSIDPEPGPRRIAELERVEPLSETSALALPGARIRGGPETCEGGMAAVLDRPVLVLDPTAGARGLAAGLAAGREHLGCDLIVLCDVGGDAIASGEEPGLASPLCDAVVLAAVPPHEREPGAPVLAAVFGAGCDGELTLDEVGERLAAVAALDAWTGTASPPPGVARELVAVAERVPTEASKLAARAALGETGTLPIRGGRRSVTLDPRAALICFFDPVLAREAVPLAAAVAGTGSLEQGRERLERLGIDTELDYELRAAAAARDAG